MLIYDEFAEQTQFLVSCYRLHWKMTMAFTGF